MELWGNGLVSRTIYNFAKEPNLTTLRLSQFPESTLKPCATKLLVWVLSEFSALFLSRLSLFRGARSESAARRGADFMVACIHRSVCSFKKNPLSSRLLDYVPARL